MSLFVIVMSTLPVFYVCWMQDFQTPMQLSPFDLLARTAATTTFFHQNFNGLESFCLTSDFLYSVLNNVIIITCVLSFKNKETNHV